MLRKRFRQLSGKLEWLGVQTNLAAVATKQALEFLCLRREVRQSGCHRTCQLLKLGKILVVRGALFGVTPEVFNGVVVG